MNRGSESRRLPVVLSLIVGLMLTIMPLPDLLQALRPDWLVLLLIFWAMRAPQTWSVGSAWLVGIILDISQGTYLGQHALALCLVAFVTVRFHLLMRVFPLPQLTATVFAILAMYQFVLFWINGVAGVDAPAMSYWGPVISGTLLWPVVMMLLTRIYMHTRSGG